MNTPEQIHEPQKIWPTCKTHCLSKSGRAKCARQARNTMRNLFALPASGWLLTSLIFFVGGSNRPGNFRGFGCPQQNHRQLQSGKPDWHCGLRLGLLVVHLQRWETISLAKNDRTP